VPVPWSLIIWPCSLFSYFPYCFLSTMFSYFQYYMQCTKVYLFPILYSKHRVLLFPVLSLCVITFTTRDTCASTMVTNNLTFFGTIWFHVNAFIYFIGRVCKRLISVRGASNCVYSVASIQHTNYHQVRLIVMFVTYLMLYGCNLFCFIFCFCLYFLWVEKKTF
jgi:hypothetical protein